MSHQFFLHYSQCDSITFQRSEIKKRDRDQDRDWDRSDRESCWLNDNLDCWWPKLAIDGRTRRIEQDVNVELWIDHDKLTPLLQWTKCDLIQIRITERSGIITLNMINVGFRSWIPDQETLVIGKKPPLATKRRSGASRRNSGERSQPRSNQDKSDQRNKAQNKKSRSWLTFYNCGLINTIRPANVARRILKLMPMIQPSDWFIHYVWFDV